MNYFFVMQCTRDNYICLSLGVGATLVGLKVFSKLLNRRKRIKNEKNFELNQNNPEEKVVIIGAGVAGICAAIKLKEKGIPFEIHEKKQNIGGTWNDNIYPGSGCDIASFLYSFSFEPNLNWTRKWASQKEILKYLQNVVDKYQLQKYIHFNSEITEAIFDIKTGLWDFTTKSENKFSSRWVICSTGQLNLPKYPTIPGIDSFKGPNFHSAHWNYDVDLTGKSVGVVGNGASAIQFIPPISKQVKELFIFQRTPSHIDSKDDFEYSKFSRFLFNYCPFYATLYRWGLYWSYEILWIFLRKGSLNNSITKLYVGRIKQRINNPEKEEVLIPKYNLGCKRILISNDYFPAVNQDHVHLLYSPVDEIVEDGIICNETKYPLDVIIYATGFQSHKFLFPMKFQGLDGVTLEQVWGGNAFAYWGITVPRFPNFFITYGPTTNLAHNSIIFMVECQVNYIVQAIEATKRGKHRFISLKQDVMDKYLEDAREALENTVFVTDCGGWYKTPTGAIINNSSFSTLAYWWNTRKFSLKKYLCFE